MGEVPMYPEEYKRLSPLEPASRGWFRRANTFFCISFLRKGEVLAYVRLSQNLKDLTRDCEYLGAKGT